MDISCLPALSRAAVPAAARVDSAARFAGAPVGSYPTAACDGRRRRGALPGILWLSIVSLFLAVPGVMSACASQREVEERAMGIVGQIDGPLVAPV